MGIISQQMDQEPDPQDPNEPQEPAQQEAQPAQPSGNQPTPVEQDAYQKVCLAGIKMLHDPQSSQAFLQMLQSEADEPPKALCDATLLILDKINEQAQNPVPPRVVIPAAGQILGEVAKVADASGVFEVTQEVKQEAVACLQANLMKKYGVSQGAMQQLAQRKPQQQSQPQQAPQQAQPEAA